MVQLGYQPPFRAIILLIGRLLQLSQATQSHLGLFVTCSADYSIAVDGQYVCQANEVRNNMDIPTTNHGNS
jgi:hypothetical protein